MTTVLNETTQYVDTGGKPLVGGRIYIGDVDADPIANPKAIFSDRELTILLVNPQTLDANGRATNKIWTDGRYSEQVNDINDVQVFQDLDRGENLGATGIVALGNVVGADIITATASPTITAYVDKEIYIYKQALVNTGAVTLNVDSLGAKAIVKFAQDPLIAGDLPADLNIPLIFNSTNDNFRMLEPSEFLPVTPPTLQVFEVSGTWNRPEGCIKIKVTAVGGGGGGGSDSASGNSAAGAGAGGTGISFIDVSSTPSVSITIGAGGAGSTGGTGPTGGTTSFGSNPSADGGKGGEASSSFNDGGAGGLATAGDIKIGGGGGGSGSTDSFNAPGVGGNSIFGGGGRGQYLTGNDALGFGGGGAGGDQARDGGDGHDGVVIVEEYY